MLSRSDFALRMGMLVFGVLLAGPVHAIPSFNFSTGGPDGRMAMGSRPSSPGKIEIESADDFILGGATSITSASFTGLMTGDATSIAAVNVEIYRVFPGDSNNPPSGNVPTRVNSPSDVAFDTRESGAGGLTFSTSTLNGTFTAANSVLSGINPVPNQFTGGEGAVSGAEVRFDINFLTPFILPGDHYFFIPQVRMTNGEFYWLSASKPISGGSGPFSPDLQTWIRDENLAPNWLRVGTDITHQGPFNAAFSLQGDAATPEPGTLTLLGLGGAILLIGFSRRK